jgi:hypothetical protein
LLRHVARLVARLIVDYFASCRLVVDYFTYAARPGASARRAARQAAHHRLLRLEQARRRLLRLRRASGCLGTSRGSSSTTSPRAGSSRGSSRRLSSTTPPRAGSSSTTSPTPRVWVPRLVAPLVVDYFALTARLGASAHRAARHAARRRLLRLAQTCHAARRTARRRLLRLAQACRRLLRLHRASGCLGTSRGSSRRSTSTTSPHAGSLSTISPTPRVRVPRHVARLVKRLVTPLVVEYSASRRLIVDYFAYTARPGASARLAARHAASHAARCRLLRLAQARRRLLLLHRASGCLGMSHGSSRVSSCGSSSTTLPRAGSSSTTLTMPRVQVPRHVARLVAPLVVDYSASRRLVVDYFAYTTRPGASARRTARHAARRAARRRLLRLA